MVRLEHACFCCSLRTGSLTLGWLSLIASIILVGSTSSSISQIPADAKNADTVIGILSFQIALYCITGCAAACLLFGIYNGISGYMIPYLVSNMLQIVGNIIMSIIIFAFLPAPLSFIPNVCVGLILNIYFYMVVYSYYKDVQEGDTGNTGYA